MSKRASLVTVIALVVLLLAGSTMALWRLNRPYPEQAAVLTSDAHYGSAVIDARGPLAYRQGHAQGARHLYARRLLSYAGPVGGVLADAGTILARLHALGLAPGEKVLVYDAGDQRDAALVTLVLQAYGVEARALRGGLSALPGPLTRAVPELEPTAKPFTRDARLLVTAADSLEHLRESAVAPVDVRPPGDYLAGHVASAVDLPAGTLLPDGSLPRYATVEALLTGAHFTRDTHVFLYAGALADAARAWLALTAYGIHHVHVLDAPYGGLAAAGAPTSSAPVAATSAKPSSSLCWQ